MNIWQAAHTVYENLPDRYLVSQALLKAYKLRKKTVPYDDTTAEFYGGEMESMTKTGYEKGLRNLWKSELVVPEFGFHDAHRKEVEFANSEISELMSQVESPTFDEEVEKLSKEERQALAKVLSVLVHGEAYALWVSSSLISSVKGTGSRMALAMQVLEEAKHFLVLREAIRKIDRIYPQTFWEQFLLESIASAEPLNRLFGMNVVLEGIALNFFSQFEDSPGLGKFLHQFHMDESRHVALPHNYARETITFWQKHSPIRQQARLMLVLPLIGVLLELEEPAQVLGLDIFEFGGRIIQKVLSVAERSGYYAPVNHTDVGRVFNVGVNVYKKVASPSGHKIQEYFKDDNEMVEVDKFRKIYSELPEPVKNSAYKLIMENL